MNNQRDFNDGERYYYLSVPKNGYDIFNIKVKSAKYDVNKHPLADTFRWMWCFDESKKDLYEKILDSFKTEILNKHAAARNQGGDFHIYVAYSDRITKICVRENKNGQYDYNNFSKKKDAETFLCEIKEFFASHGIKL